MANMMAQESFYTKLPNRGLLRISGPDRRKFLQGIISNDVNLLDRQPCVYACFLTPQGKFMHDMFITEQDETLVLDVEGGSRAQDLCHRLQVYKLRANVDIEIIAEADVFAILPPSRPPPSSKGEELRDPPPLQRGEIEGGYTFPDPRHPEMGFRSFEKPDLPERPFEDWDRHRISLGIPDGSRDMIFQRSTLIESNIDKLNGISWKKGCYLGQELTARMHYRGLAKKHLYPVRLSDDSAQQPGDPIIVEGSTIGEMRSRCGDVGMALLKDEAAQALAETSPGSLVRLP